MLVGWVSDERDLALAGVLVELEMDGVLIASVRSTSSGRVIADVPPAEYRIGLARDGFGSKWITARLGPGEPPLRIRLLSDAPIGFVRPRWVRGGEQAELCFHAVEPYRLSLWRYGLEREHLRILGWYDEHGPRTVMQVTPDGDYTQVGVGWNRVGYGGNPHHSYLVTAPPGGGLHYVHAETASGAFFGAPWVVAPAAGSPHAAIAVLASTNTWNAYNAFGGRSNYVNAAGLPPRPTLNARQDLARFDESALGEWSHPDAAYPPLSFERPEPANVVPRDARPTDPIAGRLESSLAPAEWRLLAWLEREGFGYDLYADLQLHDGTLDLEAYRVLVISVHPEYWSRRMFEQVSVWVAHGGRLVVLGGNCVNCEVELADDGRSMRCLTQLTSTDGSLGMRDARDPATWYDSRFHRTSRPEAAILGLATTETGIMTGAPYRIAAGAAGHWAFRGTGLRDGDVFGETSLHERCSGGASGHETDKRTAMTPSAFQLLAKGLNPDQGGAEIVIREGAEVNVADGRAQDPAADVAAAEGAGAVFNVGSITWVSSLLVDEAVSAITRNVLERFLARS
jgi:N,N-dimethylformamidase